MPGVCVGDLQPAHHVALDVLDLGGGVAQAHEGFGNGPVHQLEVAAPGQLLELHQGEVRLHARGVAVHEQADGAGGRQHGHLGIAVAVPFAQGQGPVPAFPGGVQDATWARRCRAGPGARMESCSYSAVGGVVGGPAVVADHPQHGVPVAREAGEGAQFPGHLGAGGVGVAGEDGGERGAPLGARPRCRRGCPGA